MHRRRVREFFRIGKIGVRLLDGIDPLGHHHERTNQGSDSKTAKERDCTDSAAQSGIFIHGKRRIHGNDPIRQGGMG